jgi:hypothetical protein
VKGVKWVVGTTTAPAHPPGTDGLTPLDRDRAASIADEGGASAAAVEAESPPATPTAPLPEEDEVVIDPDETPTFPWRPSVEKK